MVPALKKNGGGVDGPEPRHPPAWGPGLSAARIHPFGGLRVLSSFSGLARLSARIAIGVAVLVGVGCGGNKKTPLEIVIAPATATAPKGATVQFSAQLLYKGRDGGPPTAD